MKLNALIKSTPFLLTFLLIIFLSIINQKEYTKLRILIWNTPSLTLGNYLAISTGAGFIISYILTTSLTRRIPSTQNKELQFKDEDKFKESPDYKEAVNNINKSYENTLIERDIKDPSPTINASFRIIGKTERSSLNYKTTNNYDAQYDSSLEFDEQLDEQSEKNETINHQNSSMSDWDDETYSSW